MHHVIFSLLLKLSKSEIDEIIGLYVLSNSILRISELVIDKPSPWFDDSKYNIDMQAKDKLQLTWWESYIKLYIRRCKIECFIECFPFSVKAYITRRLVASCIWFLRSSNRCSQTRLGRIRSIDRCCERICWEQCQGRMILKRVNVLLWITMMHVVWCFKCVGVNV